MFEAVVEGIRYVKDVPVELTEEALDAGVLGKGSVVGLDVTVESGETVLVEVRLTQAGQEQLVKKGVKIPLEGRGGRFTCAAGWREYLLEAAESPVKPRTSTY